MSTFSGEINEIRGLSVDNFENTCHKVYFLSHCHSDHMSGLINLTQISAPLYLTNLSAVIIKKKYPQINTCIIEYGFPMNIEYTGDDGKVVQFIVTALNGTGHCMGACMFLFQIEGLDILYTGDFRISLKHAQNIKILNDIRSYNNLILYLDSTFLNESYKFFPSQSDSCNKVIEIIDKHLKKSSSNKVCLQTSARYGYERLLVEINKKFNEKIFICESAVYEQYSAISDLISCITTDRHKAKIFLKPSFISKTESDGTTLIDQDTLTIQLSAMFWRNLKKEDAFDFCTNNVHRVCYGTHNSLTELQEFIKFMKPKSINATVVPNNSIEKNIMMSLIDSIIKSYKEQKVEEVNGEPKKKFTFKRLHAVIEERNSYSQISKKIKK